VSVSFTGRLPGPAHQHAQGHLTIFRHRATNAIYDTILALGTGHTTAVWELQHSLGHHLDYLDARHDCAGSERFLRRGPRWLRWLVFIVAADVMTIPDGWRIAARYPAKRTRLRRRLASQILVQLALYAALLAVDPIAALAIFIVPNVILRWLVGWVAFAQHDGVPATQTYDGSMNQFGLLSRILLNVGHHTAHHEKPTLHWSLLPTRTAQIRDRIPPGSSWGRQTRAGARYYPSSAWCASRSLPSSASPRPRAVAIGSSAPTGMRTS
jgi:fatty acid desaturase